MVCFFIAGSVYGLVYLFILIMGNFALIKKKFFKERYILKYFALFSAPFLLMSIFFSFLFFFWVFFSFLFFLLIFSKYVDKFVLTKKVFPNNLSEGDWLAEDVYVGRNVIKKSWNGLMRQDIALLKKYNKPVLTKEGIPFAPAFLFSFLVYNSFNFLIKVFLALMLG
jgi:hypothetical protein